MGNASSSDSDAEDSGCLDRVGAVVDDGPLARRRPHDSAAAAGLDHVKTTTGRNDVAGAARSKRLFEEDAANTERGPLVCRSRNHAAGDGGDSRAVLAVRENELMRHYDRVIRAAERRELQAAATGAASLSAGAAVTMTGAAIVPKFLNAAAPPTPPSSSSSSLTKEDLERDFVDSFRSHEGYSLEPEHWNGFTVRVESSGSRHWRFVAHGPAATVQLLLLSLTTWIEKKVAYHNFNLTRTKGVLKRVELDASLPVGAELIQLSRHGKGDGLFIKTIDEAGPFAVAVGKNGTEYCAIVESVNGQPCRTTERVRRIKAQAQEKNETLRIFVKCLLPQDAALLWSDAVWNESDSGFLSGAVTPQVDGADRHTCPGGELQRQELTELTLVNGGVIESVGLPSTSPENADQAKAAPVDSADIEESKEDTFPDAEGDDFDSAMAQLAPLEQETEHTKAIPAECARTTQKGEVASANKSTIQEPLPSNGQAFVRQGALDGEVTDLALPMLSTSAAIPKKKKVSEVAARAVGVRQRDVTDRERIHARLIFPVATSLEQHSGSNLFAVNALTGREDSGNHKRSTRIENHKAAAEAVDKRQSQASEPSPFDNGIRNTAMNERVSYDIEFDCDRPLGFYCLTQKAPIPYCKIISICPHGRNVVDPRLQAETIVQGAEVNNGSSSRPVSTHLDLKARYKEAREKGVALRVTFINTNVTSASIARYRYFGKDWTHEGLWLGKCRTGWDGGEAFAARISAPLEADFNAGQHLVDAVGSGEGEASEASQMDGCIGGKREGVRFAASVKCRTFDVYSLPGEFVGDCSQHIGSNLQSLTPHGPMLANGDQSHQVKQDLSVLFVQGSIRDVLHYLDKGVSDDETAKQLDQISKKELKTELHMVSGYLSSRHDEQALARQKRELSLKDKILKIYINAAHVAKASQSLKHWERFQVVVEKLDGIKFADGFRMSPDMRIVVSVAMVYDSGKRQEPLAPLPSMPLAATVLYGKNFPSYNVNHNGVLTKGRLIEFQLNTMSQSGAPTCLAKVVVPLSDLHQRCTPDRSWREVFFFASPSGYLTGARICLRARRTALEPRDYIQTKRDDGIKLLKTLTEWISRFGQEVETWNTDFNDDLKSKGADVRAVNGISLLHSAVYLKHPSLVQRLLDQGADPASKSAVGTALSLAQNMADGKSTAGDGDQPEHMATLEDIVRMLRESLHSSPSERIRTTNEADQHDSTRNDRKHVIEPDAHYRPQKRSASEISQTSINSSMSDTVLSCDGDSLTTVADDVRSRRVVRREVSRAQPLPWLEYQDWLIPPASRGLLCRNFEARHWCRYLPCLHVHAHRLLGSDLDRASQEMVRISLDPSRGMSTYEFEHFMLTKRKKAVDGTSWWTAGYAHIDQQGESSTSQKEMIYAAGGPEVVSKQNISWYASERDAIKALDRAVAICRWASRRRVVPAGNGAVADHEGSANDRDHAHSSSHRSESVRGHQFGKYSRSSL